MMFAPRGAQAQGGGSGNGADPNYLPSAAEKKQVANKMALADKIASLSPDKAGSFFYKTLPLERAWYEPNDLAHVNYCGPGATQVALDIRLPASSVPHIDTIGREEYTNVGKTGTYTSDIRRVLNKRLNTTWYLLAQAGSKAALENYIYIDMYYNYAMVTGLKTGGMPGWGTRNVNHIVAVYGYYRSNDGLTSYVYYTETATAKAGYNGAFYNGASSANFWRWVSVNNTQVW